MQLLDDALIYSASDLNNFLECEHLTALEREVARGKLARPAKSATAELIAGKGILHEQRHLEHLQGVFGQIVTIDLGAENSAAALHAAAEATQRAMESGASIIYQGVFFDGRWLGKSDFLIRVETPSARWAWSYEVADTKLALHTKPYFIIQLSYYSEQLAAIQGTVPRHMRVILGDGRTEQFRVDDFSAYYRRLKSRFEAFLAGDPLQTYPHPVRHCNVCAWDAACQKRREDDDHLSLVARIRRDQIKKLEAHEISTLAALGTATLEQRPLTLAEPSFITLQRQAKLQLRQREAFSNNGNQSGPKHFYELLDPAEQHGFALLPQPARGDIFFDMEGDPLYMPGRSLEYLFGVYAPDDEKKFLSFWAHTPADEKHAFEAFIDYVTQRRAQFPGMHIYHYAPYEKTALRRLMGTHTTREDELDDLLRNEVFVDLYSVVRQAICISQPSYSIKKLEAFYGMERRTETKYGGDSILMYEQWLADKSRSDILQDIERYNQDDCRSTHLLREWLLQLRAEAVAAHGEIAWYEKEAPKAPAPASAEANTARADLRSALLRGLEDVDEFVIGERGDDERVRWMLANLLEYHRREQKPVWWAYYDRCERRDDLIYGDNEAIGGLTLCEDVAPYKNKPGDRNLVYTYAFPPQPHKLKGDTVHDPETRKAAGELLEIDDENNRLKLKRSTQAGEPAALRALIPGGPMQTAAQDASLERIAQSCLDGTLEINTPAITDVLLRRYPRLAGYEPGAQVQPDDVTPEALLAVVRAMDRTYLFIQGPPGSGKSTKAGTVIAELLRTGKRIGVLSNSHEAIKNLLHKVEEAALALGARFTGLQKAGDGDSQFVSRLPTPFIESVADNGAFVSREWQLAAGTSWLFARPELAGTLDYLFIDEAGQIALADTIAVAPSAANVVLLGDPLQLAQVSQGTHPDGIGASALEYLLGDAATVPANRGVFLNESYRMHPAICEFISHNVYGGRLTSAPQCKAQAVHSAPLGGSGLRFLAVEHADNAQESAEEAVRIADEIETLLLSTWTDCKGIEHLLTAQEILVVTPYNAQRRRILTEFKKRNIGVRAGTVDKFQGQEAAVVFFSMATSSSEELPRNVEFLFSRNRFNVAISRARCLAVLVASPRLLDLRCSTVEQMALTNLLCSFVATASREAQGPALPEEQLALFTGPPS